LPLSADRMPSERSPVALRLNNSQTVISGHGVCPCVMLTDTVNGQVCVFGLGVHVGMSELVEDTTSPSFHL
jgi:hypothetical protein